MASELSLTEGEEQRWASFLQPPLTQSLCTLHCAPFCLYSARTHLPFFMGLFLRINSRTVLYKILLSEC